MLLSCYCDDLAILAKSGIITANVINANRLIPQKTLRIIGFRNYFPVGTGCSTGK